MRPRLKNAREKLMRAGKEILLSKGPEEISIPELTKSCGMATGTFYRYFVSKNDFVMQIITEDWYVVVADVRLYLGGGHRHYDNTRFMFESIREFQKRYHFTGKEHLNKSEKVKLSEEDSMKKLEDLLAERIQNLQDDGELAKSIAPRKAAYLLIQFLTAAARNPEIEFDEVWHLAHYLDDPEPKPAAVTAAGPETEAETAAVPKAAAVSASVPEAAQENASGPENSPAGLSPGFTEDG
jgi:AcrR family transcriptional regulator